MSRSSPGFLIAGCAPQAERHVRAWHFGVCKLRLTRGRCLGARRLSDFIATTTLGFLYRSWFAYFGWNLDQCEIFLLVIVLRNANITSKGIDLDRPATALKPLYNLNRRILRTQLIDLRSRLNVPDLQRRREHPKSQRERNERLITPMLMEVSRMERNHTQMTTGSLWQQEKSTDSPCSNRETNMRCSALDFKSPQ